MPGRKSIVEHFRCAKLAQSGLAQFGTRWMISALFAIVLVAAALPGEAVARETYVAFVSRITVSPPAGATYRADLEGHVLEALNRYRLGRKLKALAPAGPELQAAARAHAADMLQGDFVGHTATSGAGFEARMRALQPGVMALPRMAENAARERSKGAPDAAKAERLFQQWVNSGAHARTMRSKDYITVATGLVERDGKLYAVQIFEGPQPKGNMFITKPAAATASESLY